jgi:hypothetical protein
MQRVLKVHCMDALKKREKKGKKSALNQSSRWMSIPRSGIAIGLPGSFLLSARFYLHWQSPILL